jgi:hypothetical protein
MIDVAEGVPSVRPARVAGTLGGLGFELVDGLF